MKKLLYAAVVLLYFSACMPDKFETVKIDNLYSLDVPSYMKKANDLNEDASLQYSNPLKDVHAIVIYESISSISDAFSEGEISDEYSNDLNGYTQLAMSNFESTLKNFRATPLKDETINGLRAKTTEMEGSTQRAKIYYNLACIQGKDNYYQVIVWTLSIKQSRFQEVMNRMTHSFKEL